MPKIAQELTALQVKNLKNPGLHAVWSCAGSLWLGTPDESRLTNL